MRRLRPASERGESLVELLVAVTILGVTVVAVIGGLTTSIMVSGQQRDRVAARAEVRKFAEKIQAYVLTGNGYENCAEDDHYEPGNLPDYSNLDGYTADVSSVAYWIPVPPITPAPVPSPAPTPVSVGTFDDLDACDDYRDPDTNPVTPPLQDGGIQRLSLSVVKDGTTIHEDLVIYVRRPCGTGATCD